MDVTCRTSADASIVGNDVGFHIDLDSGTVMTWNRPIIRAGYRNIWGEIVEF